jgi:hypothetical protein
MLYFLAMHNRTAIAVLAILTAASCSQKKSTESAPTSAAPVANGSAGSPGNFVEVVKNSKPIAYFRLESTSGTSEIGGAAYTSSSGVSNTTPGAPIGVANNYSAVFNNKDGAITTTQAGGIATAGSIMAWVKLGDLPSKSGHTLYVAGISQGGNDFDVQFEGDDAVRFFTAGGGSVEYKPDPASLAGTWHMIVATLDTGSKQRALYWDGKLAKADTEGGTPNKTGAFSIGESTVFKGRFFNGEIDEVALWDRALSGAEVLNLYNSAHP